MTWHALLSVLLLPSVASAAEAHLLWEFPRSYRPAPDHFRITLEQPASVDAYTVVPGTSAACGVLGPVEGDTFCATLPACPPEGLYRITVQALWGTDTSPASNSVTCVFTGQMPCQCLAVQMTPPPVAPQPASPLPPSPLAASPSSHPSPGTPLASAPLSLPLSTFPTLPAQAAPT